MLVRSLISTGHYSSVRKSKVTVLFFGFFNPFNFVAQFFGAFVILFLNRFFHFAAHANQFRALLGAAGAVFGFFPLV